MSDILGMSEAELILAFAAAEGREVRPVPPRRAPRTRLRESSQVYLLRRGDYVKIGRTSDLATRMRMIADGRVKYPSDLSPGPAALIALVRGYADREGQLHHAFREDRVSGTEWFRVTPRLLRLAHLLGGGDL